MTPLNCRYLTIEGGSLSLFNGRLGQSRGEG